MANRAEMIVALDGMDDVAALRMVEKFGGDVKFYKIGLELFTRYGPRLVHEVHERGKSVFLDAKYHDIPATVAGAVSAAVDLGISLVNVHASGGREMLEAAVESRGSRDTRLIAVTVLTSRGGGGGVADEVLRLALQARDAGADGVVAAVGEVEMIKRSCGGEFLVITPGIRPAGAERHDQVRLATPAEAARVGSDFIVVGRAITTAEDPHAAAREILKEISGE